MTKKLHKIYREVYRALDRVWFTFEIRDKHEYYIGSGALMAVKKRFLWWSWLVHDLQALRMISFPPSLHYLMAAIIDNASTYDDFTDRYDQLNLGDAYLRAIASLQDAIASIGQKAYDTMDPEDINYKLLMANVAQLKKKYMPLTANDTSRPSGVLRELFEDGYVPFWTENSIRTRAITLVRQADANTFIIAEVKEFIPRDQRQSCSFISMTSVNIDHEVAKTIDFEIILNKKGTVI